MFEEVATITAIVIVCQVNMIMESKFITTVKHFNK